jgi:hypothetical protein
MSINDHRLLYHDYKVARFHFQHRKRTKIIIPGISLNTHYSFSLRLSAQVVTYHKGCYSMNFKLNYKSVPL